jgi:hypothetical protein
MGMKMKMNYSPKLGMKMKINYSPILGMKLKLKSSPFMGILKLKPHLAMIIKSKCDAAMGDYNIYVACAAIIESVTRILRNLCIPMAFRGDTHESENLRSSWEDSRFLVGGGKHGKFAGEVIAKYLHNDHGLKGLSGASFMFEYQCKMQDVDAAFEKSPLLVSVTLPLHDLIPNLTRPELTSVTQMHGVGMYSRLSVGEAKEHMLSHVCNCPDIVSLMSMVNVVPHQPRALKNKSKIATKNAKAYTKRKEVKSLPSEAYTLKLKLDIMNKAK